jgi:hypothetical protein
VPPTIRLPLRTLYLVIRGDGEPVLIEDRDEAEGYAQHYGVDTVYAFEWTEDDQYGRGEPIEVRPSKSRARVFARRGAKAVG